MALGVCLLLRKQLLDVYGFLVALGLLLLSYGYNTIYVQHQLQADKYLEDISDIFSSEPSLHLSQLILQGMLGFSYNALRYNVQPHPSGLVSRFIPIRKYQMWTYLIFILPVIFRLAGLPPLSLSWVPLIAAFFMGIEFVLTVLGHCPAILFMLHRTYISTRYMLRNLGFQVFVESQWDRIHVPQVLRLFWASRTFLFLMYFTYTRAIGKINLGNSEHTDLENSEHTDLNPELYGALDIWDIGDIWHVMQETLVTGCDTYVALLGMTSVVSHVTQLLGMLMAAVITSEAEEDRSMGTMCAILFFILALQTGLTGLEPEKRLVRLFRNFCLLITAILHFVHGMVHPMLMNISASPSIPAARHARVLVMCALLLILPTALLSFLWPRYPLSTWLLAVTAFSIEVMIKVLISLLIYTLFMIDANRETLWDKLDDYIYYIKSTGNTVEFLFGIFLFCNGAWILLFESGGFIRATMMCIHAYFNIFLQAKQGWKVFMKRRTAVAKINSLPVASECELKEHNDICAICYQELFSARITRCQHLFHSSCLRKWLYTQDQCPLCHQQMIYEPISNKAGDSTNNPEEEEEEVLPNGQAVDEVQHQHQD